MLRTAVYATTALGLSLSAAVAAPAVGLVGDKTLVMFDTETLEVSGMMEVSGVDSLLGIDLRPSNGTLVGVTAEMGIVSIDTATGAATEMSMMDTALEVNDMPVIVDFNPAADKLRFMTGTTNHRVDVDTGAVTVDGSLDWQEGDMHVGEAPAIVAAAYINSYGKPETTKMFDIDSTIVAVIQQVSPNDGTLGAIGKLGIDSPADTYAFDVQTTAEMENMAWLVNGNMLYSVDLDSGAATGVGMIEGIDGQIRDITVLPAM
ncbi:hypothetical protein P775_09115 [Puniceibacterium antarcticum]|uniref:DUF4394 domain-containing protein n=1 Tax=Puniceibacterium antarcticum TaxID=1206336 RepID=A0A2G8RGI1_9RHOB|nr:DUF4394 domain-containing protein [Puniceibacterium antarcticum]PIL20677.1 hypothetical protein P775_09115 [Puniceibacterium antarcticum]